MTDDYAQDYYVDETPTEDRLDELEQRIEELQSVISQESSRGEAGISLVFGMGMTLAMILSWFRNASILWCMVHGLCSWGYVIYYAASR